MDIECWFKIKSTLNSLKHFHKLKVSLLYFTILFVTWWITVIAKFESQSTSASSVNFLHLGVGLFSGIIKGWEIVISVMLVFLNGETEFNHAVDATGERC